LGRLDLAQAEVIFEYRSDESAGPAQQRKEYRAGFLSFHDDLWDTVNLRNDKQHYQDGLFIWDITDVQRAGRAGGLPECHLPPRLSSAGLRPGTAVRPPSGDHKSGRFSAGITVENMLRQHSRGTAHAEALSAAGSSSARARRTTDVRGEHQRRASRGPTTLVLTTTR